jgi:hypothetical protein
VVQSTLPLSGSISYNNNNSIQIGAEASDGTNPDYSLAFTGSIDEVMIYNKALTVDEIKADIPIFSSSQDLVLYMPFNGNFNDESPSPMTQARYNNALTSMPYLTTDRRGNSGSNAYFSDRTNYLVMTNADKITSLGTNYSMSAWINLDSGIADHGIFSTWNANSGMIFRVYNYQVQNQNFTCPTTITPGQWVHVVGITEGTTAKIYFNGTLCNSGGGGSVSNLPSDYANKWLLVGADYIPSAYSRALKGKMDDLRIYNRVLSATEVWGLYNYEK